MADLDYLLTPIREELLDRVCQGEDSVGSCFYSGFGYPQGKPACVDAFTAASLHDDPSFLRIPEGLEDASLDCLVVDLVFHWAGFRQQLATVLRVLRPGGRLIFSTFGPDTLRQARSAWAGIDEFPHVHEFEDMHHLGDALVAAGFHQPIVDAQWINVEFPGARALMADLRGSGMTNVNPDRRRTLTGKTRIAEFIAAYNSMGSNGLVNETFEIIYGMAVRPEALPGQGPVSVKVNPPA